MSIADPQPRANKMDAGNGTNGICRVIDAHRSPRPDSGRQASARVIFAWGTARGRFLHQASCHEARESGGSDQPRVSLKPLPCRPP